jgi:signal transduction histidine kinase
MYILYLKEDSIFHLFFTTKKGMALGLSITNDILNAHGDRIEIRTISRKNSVLTIHSGKRRHD